MSHIPVLVIGAGPAGIAAALRLARYGIDVTVVDENPSPGGQIWRGAGKRAHDPDFAFLGDEYRKGAQKVDEFLNAAIDYRPSTSLWHLGTGWRAHLVSGQGGTSIRSEYVIAATGAQERPFPFDGWTLPGVMTIGAAQILLKTAANIPREPVWLVGAGPLLPYYAHQLIAAGGAVEGILYTARKSDVFRAAGAFSPNLYNLRQVLKGVSWLARLQRRVRHIEYGVSNVRIGGRERAERLHYNSADGREKTVPVQGVFTHNGLVPSLHLQNSIGCAYEWDAAAEIFRTTTDAFGQTSRPRFYLAGDGMDIGGVDAAWVRGDISACKIAFELGKISASEFSSQTGALFRKLTKYLSNRAFLNRLYPVAASMDWMSDEGILCRCENVRIQDIRKNFSRGLSDKSLIKNFTRMGMGPCQGRQCMYSLASGICRASGLSMAEVGLPKLRGPLKPISLGCLADQDDAERSAP